MAASSRPVALALIAALLWGLWWIPLRALEATGMTGSWASAAMLLICAVLISAALFVVRREPFLSRRAFAGAAIVGAAIAFYGVALNETSVVRAILLFYLAPAWAIALECAFMGRRFRAVNAVALALAAAGIVLIFRGELDLTAWGAGDAIALASGLAWAVGTSLLFAQQVNAPARSALATSVSAALCGALAGLALGTPAPTAAMSDALALLVLGAVFLAPVIVVTMWSASVLAPATLSFLLTAEIISGVASSALLLDEPFGAPEALGAIMVTLAATLEVFSAPAARSAADP